MLTRLNSASIIYLTLTEQVTLEIATKFLGEFMWEYFMLYFQLDYLDFSNNSFSILQ